MIALSSMNWLAQFRRAAKGVVAGSGACVIPGRESAVVEETAVAILY